MRFLMMYIVHRICVGIMVGLYLPFSVFGVENNTSFSSSDITKMPGWRIMQDSRLGNCVTCHTVFLPNANPNRALSEKQGNFAPSLNHIGNKYSREQLFQWVYDARSLKPQTLMPPFGTMKDLQNPIQNRPILNAEQIVEVVEVLELLK